MTTNQCIVSECEGCAMPDFLTGCCTAFLDPAYQHRDGQRCWGRCDSAEEMIRRLEAIVAHNTLNGGGPRGNGNIWTLRAELRDWQETVKALQVAEEVKP